MNIMAITKYIIFIMINFKWNNGDVDYDNYDNDSWDDNDILPHDVFVNNDMKIEGLGLVGSNDIVINQPECNIYFNWPMTEDYVTYRLVADNKNIGFTRGEIALKAMQKYHMMAFICNNYDSAKGCVRYEDNSRGDVYKKTFGNFMWIQPYYGNGLWHLIYEADYDRYRFECYENM